MSRSLIPHARRVESRAWQQLIATAKDPTLPLASVTRAQDNWASAHEILLRTIERAPQPNRRPRRQAR